MLNCDESLQADPIGLLTEVADLAGLDAGRVRQWLFARCVQESLVAGSRACPGPAAERNGGPAANCGMTWFVLPFKVGLR